MLGHDAISCRREPEPYWKGQNAMSIAADVFCAHAEKRALLYALVAAGLISLAAVAWQALPSASCRVHQGSFSADFSRDFDTGFMECRSSALSGLVIEFDGQFPYMSLRRQ
jgi:hypothetical protein